MTCKICGNESTKLFDALVLKKYKADYFRCTRCGFIQTEEPYWLSEAYGNAINMCDTGLLDRNIRFSEIATLLLYFFFNRNAPFLDYAGGYGVFTRLMRDIGFDFYWCDLYCDNLFARGFEYDPSKDASKKIELITTFESFEHFANPRAELATMLKISRNILFSTDLVPNPIPRNPEAWWYFAPEHGQHISFYTRVALAKLAEDNGLHYYTDGKRLHLFTEKDLPRLWGTPFSFSLLRRLKKLRFPQKLVRRKLQSKIESDSQVLL